MRAMHNPDVSPVDNSSVGKCRFNPQLARTNKTGVAPVENTVVKRCTWRNLWGWTGYPQMVTHIRFISSSEKLFICLFFFFMLSPIRVSDQAPPGDEPAGTVHPVLYMERLVGN